MWLRLGRSLLLPRAASRARGLAPRRDATLLAALVERSPQITPDRLEHEDAQLAHELSKEALHKVYPKVVTAAEEGPDQQRARLRMEELVEREGSREGEADRTGDTRSLDRRLAQRLYLLVQVKGQWQFPQQEWQQPVSSRDGLSRVLEASCGSELTTHQMGNAPLGHLPLANGDALFLWRHLYVSGTVNVPAECDYMWVTKEELINCVDGELGHLASVACGPFA